MNDLFHDMVDKSFIEFFLTDMLKNYKTLEMLSNMQFDDETIKETKEIVNSILEEELIMLDIFLSFRVPTLKELELIKEIKQYGDKFEENTA